MLIPEIGSDAEYSNGNSDKVFKSTYSDEEDDLYRSDEVIDLSKVSAGATGR